MRYLSLLIVNRVGSEINESVYGSYMSNLS